MATYKLRSLIKLGAYEAQGVIEVSIERSIYSIVETAKIKIPGKARIVSKVNPTNPSGYKSVFELIQPGTAVTINLGYNNTLNEEFKGYVESVTGAEIVTINCVGYVWQLRKNIINKFWKQTTLKELLNEVVKGTDITYSLNVEIPIEKLLVENGNGAKLLNDIVERIGGGYITAFFIEPTVLWVGLRYAPVRNTVKYRLGYNTIEDTLTHEAIEPSNVTLIYRHPNGKRVYAKTKGIGSKEIKLTTSYINSSKAITEITKWAEQKNNNDTVRGEITQFLAPVAHPGDKAVITSERYPHKAGAYVIESTKVVFGGRGARRIAEIGQKIGVIDAEADVEIIDNSDTEQ